MILTQQVVRDLYDSFPGGMQFALGAVVLALFAVRRRYPVVSLLGVASVLGLLCAAGLPAAVIAYTTAKRSYLVRGLDGPS